jgi:dolichol kinase
MIENNTDSDINTQQSESIEMKIREGTNVYRIFYHLLGLLIPVGYYWIVKDKKDIFIIIFILFSLFFIGDIIRLNFRKFNQFVTSVLKRFMKREEAQRFSGSSYYLFACSICIFFYPKIIAITAIIFLCIGDPSASIIGRLFGRIRLFRGDKSLEGSLTMLVTNSIIGYLLLGPFVGIIGAISSTLIEMFPFHLLFPNHYKWIDDNATIPIFSGLVMFLIY